MDWLGEVLARGWAGLEAGQLQRGRVLSESMGRQGLLHVAGELEFFLDCLSADRQDADAIERALGRLLVVAQVAREALELERLRADVALRDP